MTEYSLNDPDISSIDYVKFRHDLTEFMVANCPQALRDKVFSNQKIGRTEFAEWQKILHTKGWSAPNWPIEEGGTGWDLRQRYLFEEVSAELDCPPLYHHGLGHIGPVIMHFGTPEQKARFLPRILDGTEWWCQGYSEPGAGSDLASLRTSAVLEGDEYVIKGQKIWTSHAHEADMMYTLVRTSTEGRKQAGITLLLVPVNAPGIVVKPIRTIDQWHHVNEVFLTDVRVPVLNRISEEGGGWACAKFLLDRERLSPAMVPRLLRQLQQVETLIRSKVKESGATPTLLSAISRLLNAKASAMGAKEMLMSAITEEMSGTLRSSKSSALKLHCTELSQQISSLAYDLVAPHYATRLIPSTPDAEGSDDLDIERQLLHTYLFYRSRTIAGGTSEVQKNVIARDIFGV
jgi:alkylation response protein AidB-like acyl-CoA dehydrogenase